MKFYYLEDRKNENKQESKMSCDERRFPVRSNFLPLHKPDISKKDVKAMLEVIETGRTLGNGPIGRLLETNLEKFTNAKYALFTTSCTSALEIALICCDIKDGDEVLCPAFTFVSVVNAIIACGARPVFVDIKEDTMNINTDLIEKAISRRTKAIIPVHYAGQACEMDKICDMAYRHKIKVIEDAAHGIGAFYKQRHLGTIGDVGCVSFDGTKNISCGEGGALLTCNSKIAKRADVYREKGTDKSRYLRGEIKKYTWIARGSSCVQSDILAALLIEQLKRVEYINMRRAINAQYLNRKLEKFKGVIKLPYVIKESRTNWHIYAIRVNENIRDWIVEALRSEGIGVASHYIPLHTTPFGKKILGYKRGDFPITERVCDSIIRIPVHTHLLKKDLDNIIRALNKIIFAKDE